MERERMTTALKDTFVIALAVLVTTITAWYSVGYHHADEHYQIIEFARTLDSDHDRTGLPWEYHAHIRPSLQPVIVYGMLKAFSGIGIIDPYHQAFLLRISSGLLALLCTWIFTRAVRGSVQPDLWSSLFLLSCFLWFLPFLNVRCSSENWSAAMLLLAVAVALHEHLGSGRFLVLGALIGLAFEFRYQTVFASLGLVCWMYTTKRIQGWSFLALTGSLFVIVVLASAVDVWFYGEPVFAPWNYLHTNLFEGVASEYGERPWYWYPYLVLRNAFFPVGAIILLAFFRFVYKARWDVVVWLSVPFLIAHFSIAHKELRFLFPLAIFVPYMLIRWWQDIRTSAFGKRWHRQLYALLLGLVMINCIALVASALKPADLGRMRITEHLHRTSPEKPITVLCAPGCDPLDPWGGLNTRHYAEHGVSYMSVEDLNALQASFNADHDHLLVKQAHLTDPNVTKIIEDHQLRLLITSMPPGLVPWLGIYGAFPLKDMLILYGRPA